jgi:8-oxo-dGTP pyrophosphatase MutT (NUDIX family)
VSAGGGEVEVLSVPREHARSLRVLIDRRPARVDAETARRTEEVWARKARENPRLFGGGVLSVESLDLARGIVRARADEYKRLVVRPEVETGVCQLSASAVLLAPDGRGRESVLLGKRGAGTRMYPGLWQVCPAGGVEPPGDGRDELTHADLAAEVAREMREEAGIELGEERPRALWIVRDVGASSCDIVLRVGLERAVPAHPQRGALWEHDELRWVALAELGAFAREHRLVSSTRAVLGQLVAGPP